MLNTNAVFNDKEMTQVILTNSLWQRGCAISMIIKLPSGDRKYAP